MTGGAWRPGGDGGGGGRAGRMWGGGARRADWGFRARGSLSGWRGRWLGLGTVLLIAALTRRYGLAGVVAAAGSVGYAVAAPQFAKLTDRYGQRRVLRPQVMVFTAATAALMVLAEARAPLAVVGVSSLLAGST